MITFLFVLGLVVLLTCLILIFYITKSEIILSLVYKMNMCDKEVDEFLKIKEDLILRVINIITKELNTEYKVFDKVKKIKTSNLDEYEKDILLSDAYFEVNNIYQDSYKLKELKSLDGIMKDLNKNEIKLISLRTLYNKCAGEFNNIYKKFPYNYICKLRKFNIRKLYEGKELNSEIEKELNLII